MKKFFRKLIKRIFQKLKYINFETFREVENEHKIKRQNTLLQKLAYYGEGLYINGEITITDPHAVFIGHNVHIGNNAYLNTLGGLYIGDNVHISRNLVLYTSNHNINGGIPYNHELRLKPVIIKKNVWIGMNVCITPGVTIGEGAIIGLGSVISKDVPNFAIVGNQPFRQIGTRDINIYSDLISEKNIGGRNGKLNTNHISAKYSNASLGNGENLFFVLSTGRSGSKSTSVTLNTHPNVICHHEITDSLIRLSTEYEYGVKSKNETLEELKALYLDSDLIENNCIFGESNQKLVNLAPLLHEIFPSAKFIWVIRDGRDVVASTFARNWYASDTQKDGVLYDPNFDIWHNYRIRGDLANYHTTYEWNMLNQFEKNCWYWTYWNGKIEEFFNTLPSNQKFFLRLEDASAKKYNEIFSFLNVKPKSIEVSETNKAMHPVIKHQHWDENRKESFSTICSALMRKYYPEEKLK